MINIPAQAISFDLFYGGKSASEALDEGVTNKETAIPAVSVETPQFKNITIRDINCKGALQGIFLKGLPEMNLENITFENIRMESNIGLTCEDANGIKIRNLSLSAKKMPLLDFKNSRNVVLDGFKYPATINQLFHFSGAKTENVKLKNSGVTDKEKQMVVDKDVSANTIKLVE
jgi:hypothetical protein